jgi:hypothetical protein
MGIPMLKKSLGQRTKTALVASERVYPTFWKRVLLESGIAFVVSALVFGVAFYVESLGENMLYIDPDTATFVTGVAYFGAFAIFLYYELPALYQYLKRML